MELSGKVSQKTSTESREIKSREVIANIRNSSPEFSTADNLSRNTLFDQARTSPDFFYSREIVKDDSQ